MQCYYTLQTVCKIFKTLLATLETLHCCAYKQFCLLFIGNLMRSCASVRQLRVDSQPGRTPILTAAWSLPSLKESNREHVTCYEYHYPPCSSMCVGECIVNSIAGAETSHAHLHQKSTLTSSIVHGYHPHRLTQYTEGYTMALLPYIIMPIPAQQPLSARIVPPYVCERRPSTAALPHVNP